MTHSAGSKKALLERTDNVTASSPPTSKDRDSGIVITQEIKSVIDAANQSADLETFGLGGEGVSEIDIIDKYKTMCKKFQVKMKELTSKFVLSEEKVIELATQLAALNSTVSW